MSTYTTQLATLVEQPTQHIKGLTYDQRIEAGRKILFDFEYPMFDERYKAVFERHFIEHFYEREIGFETEYLFKRRLKNWLNLNMGYWSKMFESESIKFDPLINSRVDVKHTKKNDENTKNDRVFGETNSRDVTDKTVTDEDTTENTTRGIVGSTTYDTNDNTNGTESRNTTSNMTGNTSGTSDGTSNTTEHETGTSDGTSNTTEHETGSEDNTGSRNQDNFNRQLHSDTPDSRLSITVKGSNNAISGDGEGSAGYASDITENRGFENEDTESRTDRKSDGTTETRTHDKTNTDGTTETRTHDETNTDSTQNQVTDESGQHSETQITSEKGSSTEDTKTTETGTRDETVDRTAEESGKRNFDEGIVGEVNSMEDFVQARVGKIGVQTYSKMLTEYRETFLRIEKNIFDEMNVLFMLVY